MNIEIRNRFDYFTDRLDSDGKILTDEARLNEFFDPLNNRVTQGFF